MILDESFNPLRVVFHKESVGERKVGAFKNFSETFNSERGTGDVILVDHQADSAGSNSRLNQRSLHGFAGNHARQLVIGCEKSNAVELSGVVDVDNLNACLRGFFETFINTARRTGGEQNRIGSLVNSLLNATSLR